MGVSQLARELEMTPGGMHKIMSLLLQEGFVSQDPHSKQYRLGVALYRLGNEYDYQKGLRRLVQPTMQEIADSTGQWVSLGIREGNDAILFYRVSGPKLVGIDVKIGLKYPINASAIGKCLAAYHPMRELMEKRVFSEDLQGFTKFTIVDPRKLVEEYKNIRTSGVSVSRQEHHLNESAIAVPIKDRTGNTSMCLSIGNYSENGDTDSVEKLIPYVLDAAESLAVKLQYKDL
jgi:DNA-binding IclR family transcriptional regulator